MHVSIVLTLFEYCFPMGKFLFMNFYNVKMFGRNNKAVKSFFGRSPRGFEWVYLFSVIFLVLVGFMRIKKGGMTVSIALRYADESKLNDEDREKFCEGKAF